MPPFLHERHVRVLERDVEAVELAAIRRPRIADRHVLGAHERSLSRHADTQSVDADGPRDQVVVNRLIADVGAERRVQSRERVVDQRALGRRQVDPDHEDGGEDASPQERATETARPARPTRLGGPLILAHGSILAIIPACDSFPARCSGWPWRRGSGCRIRRHPRRNPIGTSRCEPFRIIGNIYYVGTNELGAYLLKTPEGAILVDGGLPESAPLIAHSIEAIGVPLGGVKILLTTQAHFDHVGSLAELAQKTGGRVMVMAGDAELVEKGGHGDYLFGDTMAFPPAKVGEVLHDGSTITLGGTTLVAHLTPATRKAARRGRRRCVRTG